MHASEGPTDVAVIGSGLCGSIVALALKRAGLSVRLLDMVTHPRFAIGESVVPADKYWLRVLAKRWNLPELDNLTSIKKVNSNVAQTSGMKAGINFAYHAKGEEMPVNGWIIPIGAALEETSESHWYRPDIDAYLYQSAIKAGVHSNLGTRITKVDLRDDGVSLYSDRGQQFDAQFVVDATSFRSVLNEALGLRDETPIMRTNSRAQFTHMLNVKPFDDVCGDFKKSFYPWSLGTLHHMFDGGWMWVIPFDNYPGSNNPLCSIGLMFDNERYPAEKALDPDSEWEKFLAEYPSIAKQFEDASLARPWVATRRMQFSSQNCYGDRYWVTPAASFNVDPMYSMGLANVLQMIAATLDPLIDSVKTGEFDKSRFAGHEALVRELHVRNDAAIYGTYRAMHDKEVLGAYLTFIIHFILSADRFPAKLFHMGGEPCGSPFSPETLAAIEACVPLAEASARGELEPREAARKIMEAIDASDIYAKASSVGSRLTAEHVRNEIEEFFFSTTFARRERMTRRIRSEFGESSSLEMYKLFDYLESLDEAQKPIAEQVFSFVLDAFDPPAAS